MYVGRERSLLAQPADRLPAIVAKAVLMTYSRLRKEPSLMPTGLVGWQLKSAITE